MSNMDDVIPLFTGDDDETNGDEESSEEDCSDFPICEVQEATVYRALLDLRKSTPAQNGDRKLPPTEDVSLLIDQLFSCGDVSLLQLVRTLAYVARERASRACVTQTENVFIHCARLLQDTQDDGLKKELLRFFCNSCAEMSKNRQTILQIDGLFEGIVRTIGNQERSLGYFALSATQNIIRRNPAGQQKMKLSGILPDLLWLLDVPCRDRTIDLDTISDLMWSLLGQVQADLRNFGAVKLLLENLVGHSAADTLPFLSLVSKLLQMDDWQAMVAREPGGAERKDTILQLVLRLIARFSERSDFLLLGGNDESLAEANLIKDPESEQAAVAFKNIGAKIYGSIADIMVRNDFHENFPPTCSVIQTLTTSLTSVKGEQMQAALLVILGDYANSDVVCTKLLSSTEIFCKTIDVMKTSTAWSVVLATCGLLRHLLTPKSQRSHGDSVRLIQVVMKTCLGHSPSSVRQACLHLTCSLLEGSEKSIEHVFELAPEGKPFYILFWDEFECTETPYMVRLMAARCCTRILIRLCTAEPNVRAQYQEHQEGNWSRFTPPLIYLLGLDINPIKVEVFYALCLLSNSKVLDSPIQSLLQRRTFVRNLVAAVLSEPPAGALRSNALRLADSMADDINTDQQQRIWLRDLVSNPQTVDEHMLKAEAILPFLFDEGAQVVVQRN